LIAARDRFKVSLAQTLFTISRSVRMKFLNECSLPIDSVKRMAYLRKEKETVEIAHSLNRVWTAISKMLTSLEWNTEQIDNTTHHVKAETKASLNFENNKEKKFGKTR
jgi:hypothetical protein